MVTTTTPGGRRVSICTCTRTGRHLATFTRRLGSNLYILAIEPPQVATFAQVYASGQVAPPCSCRLLSHQTLLWHHCLGHPSLPRLRGMHSRLLGLAHVSGQVRERYFLLFVDDYTRYTTVFPLHSKGQVVDVLIPWIRAIRLQLRERFHADLPVLRLHSDRGGEFSSDHLRDFCRKEGILHSFTLLDPPQQNGTTESRIGLVISTSGPLSPCQRPHLLCVGRGRLAMRLCSGSGALVPLFAIRPQTSSPPALFPASSLAFPLTCLASGFTTPPRAVSSPLRTSRLTNPFPPHGPAPSGVSQVDPLPGVVPVEVAGDSGAARGAASKGVGPRGAEPGGAESEGAGCGGAKLGGAEPGGADP
ncbi:unnamed protein product [Closterium sp. NIES-54]